MGLFRASDLGSAPRRFNVTVCTLSASPRTPNSHNSCPGEVPTPKLLNPQTQQRPLTEKGDCCPGEVPGPMAISTFWAICEAVEQGDELAADFAAWLCLGRRAPPYRAASVACCTRCTCPWIYLSTNVQYTASITSAKP